MLPSAFDLTLFTQNFALLYNSHRMGRRPSLMVRTLLYLSLREEYVHGCEQVVSNVPLSRSSLTSAPWFASIQSSSRSLSRARPFLDIHLPLLALGVAADMFDVDSSHFSNIHHTYSGSKLQYHPVEQAFVAQLVRAPVSYP